MCVLVRFSAALAAALFVMILAGPTGSAGAQSLTEKGEKLAKSHCARCHVVADGNSFSGIGSTMMFHRSRGESPKAFMSECAGGTHLDLLNSFYLLALEPNREGFVGVFLEDRSPNVF